MACSESDEQYKFKASIHLQYVQKMIFPVNI